MFHRDVKERRINRKMYKIISREIGIEKRKRQIL
jgi:hypothetical protein